MPQFPSSARNLLKNSRAKRVGTPRLMVALFSACAFTPCSQLCGPHTRTTVAVSGACRTICEVAGGDHDRRKYSQKILFGGDAHALARYAALSQEAGLSPLVEPEILMDGDHTIARHLEVTGAALTHVFNALYEHRAQACRVSCKCANARRVLTR